MKNKIPWEGAEDGWRGRLRSFIARIKMLFLGRKAAPAPRAVQVQLMPDRTPNLEQKQTKGTEGCPRRQHHSRGIGDERGHV